MSSSAAPPSLLFVDDKCEEQISLLVEKKETQFYLLDIPSAESFFKPTVQHTVQWTSGIEALLKTLEKQTVVDEWRELHLPASVFRLSRDAKRVDSEEAGYKEAPLKP